MGEGFQVYLVHLVCLVCLVAKGREHGAGSEEQGEKHAIGLRSVSLEAKYSFAYRLKSQRPVTSLTS